MSVAPYLFFEGHAEEAIAFYKTNLGAELNSLMRFKECPDGQYAPGSEEKVMHADVTIGESQVLISDGYNRGELNFAGFGLALTVKTEAEADKVFDALAAGGNVAMPLAKTFFSPRFGVVTDKFGIKWMIMTQ